MMRLFVFFLSFFLFLTPFLCAGNTAFVKWNGDRPAEVVANEVLFSFKDSTLERDDLSNEVEGLVSEVFGADHAGVEAEEILRRDGMNFWLLRYPGGKFPGVIEVINRVRSRESVSDAQPNFIYRAIDLPQGLTDAGYFGASAELQEFEEPAPPAFLGPVNSLALGGGRWNMNMIKVPQAHMFMQENNLWKRDITIAVLDTGFFSKHPALKQRVYPVNYYYVIFYTGAQTYTTTSEYDQAKMGYRLNYQTGQYEQYMVTGGWHDWQGHGTHCAGVVAGSYISNNGFHGVAPGYRVMPVKVLDDEGSGNSGQIIQGVYWAKDHGADVLSMSLGGEGADGFSQKVYEEMANKYKIPVVAASGNSYEQGNPRNYPGAYPSVISVGSLGSDGFISYFSQSGDWVSVLAPGGDGYKKNRGGTWRQVLSSWSADPRAIHHTAAYPKEPGDDGKLYVGISGTSMATPHVAGLVALIRSVNYSLTPQQIKALLQQTGVKPAGGFHDKQKKLCTNAKIVNALEALKAAKDARSN